MSANDDRREQMLLRGIILLEMLIVTSIIGFLAAWLLPSTNEVV